MNEPQVPLLLCHAACTGGSLIFRELCSHFGLWGLSEVSHLAAMPKKAYMPYDPETLMYHNGWIDSGQFEDVFSRRLSSCQQLAAEKEKRLLIREHTHALFFGPTDSPSPTGFSWIDDCTERLFGESCPTIVSYRDPVDSWLGLKGSFPSIAGKFTFEEYCQRYLVFAQRVASANDRSDLLVFKYEDLVSDRDSVLNTVASRLNLKASGSKVKVASTGNSGRQTSQIRKRPRRAYSMGFIKAAEQSTSYAKLAELLGYEHCAESLQATERMAARFNSGRKFFFSLVKSLAGSAKGMIKRTAVAD